MYQCNECSKSYCWPQDLQRHIKAKHSKQQQQQQKKQQQQQQQSWWETASLIPLQPCSSMMISGATGSGKTTWVYHMLQHLKEMYIAEPPVAILYCYGIYQPLFDEMRQKLANFTLHQGLPTSQEIEEYTEDKHHRLIILDDLMQQVIKNDEMELLFTQGCHHRRLSVIFISQNLIPQGKNSRNIALNTWYLVLLKNIRDALQVAYLGRQIFPGKSKYLSEAYEDSIRREGYLLIDMSPTADERYRVRTRIFPGEFPIIYLPKS